jgi:ribonuclease HI
MSNELIKIYTDGACSGNPGPGGFGWVLLFKDRKVEHAEGEALTTNNKMELAAVISALKYFDENKKSSKKYTIEIHTDSNLIVQAINQHWLESWASKGWRKADKEPVKNKELWEALLAYLRKYDVKFNWVKGHAGEEYNERCDELARDASKGLLNNYHKIFKLVKTPENMFETAPAENQTTQMMKMSESQSTEENRPHFFFEWNNKTKSIIIEQLSGDSKEVDFNENLREIVLTRSNIDEFQEKLNNLISKLKK